MKLKLRAFGLQTRLPRWLAWEGREVVQTRGASFANEEDRLMSGLSGVKDRTMRTTRGCSRVGLRRGFKTSPWWRVELKNSPRNSGNSIAPRLVTFGGNGLRGNVLRGNFQ